MFRQKENFFLLRSKNDRKVKKNVGYGDKHINKTKRKTSFSSGFHGDLL